MKRTKRRPVKKRVIRSRERAQALFEGWRKKLTNLQIELKRPRVIDTVLVDFLRDEVPERQGQPTQKFSGRLIFFTKDDATIPTRIRTNETFAVRLSSVGVAKLRSWAGLDVARGSQYRSGQSSSSESAVSSSIQ